MKVLNAEPITTTYHYIVMDDGNHYERYSADCWRWVIGESTENCYNTGELEAAFQTIIDQKGDL